MNDGYIVPIDEFPADAWIWLTRSIRDHEIRADALANGVRVDFRPEWISCLADFGDSDPGEPLRMSSRPRGLGILWFNPVEVSLPRPNGVPKLVHRVTDFRVHLDLDDPVEAMSAEGPLAAPVATLTPPAIPPSKMLPKTRDKEVIRPAVRAVYDNAMAAGEKPPNVNELPPLVNKLLEADGFQARWEDVRAVGNEVEFEDLRGAIGVHHKKT